MGSWIYLSSVRKIIIPNEKGYFFLFNYVELRKYSLILFPNKQKVAFPLLPEVLFSFWADSIVLPQPPIIYYISVAWLDSISPVSDYSSLWRICSRTCWTFWHLSFLLKLLFFLHLKWYISSFHLDRCPVSRSQWSSIHILVLINSCRIELDKKK